MAGPRLTLTKGALVALLSAGCTDPVDKAAKARIFSPEAPAQVVASASEALPPDQITSDPRIARRVLEMGAAEATERLGAFAYHANTQFAWTEPSELTLSEERTLKEGTGGVGGDFDAVVDNSRDQGLEVLRAGGRVFAKSRYGTLRERKRDRGMSERVREETYSALRDVTALFLGRVKLEPQGTVSNQGRAAWRFRVSLAPAAAPAKDVAAAASNLPPPAYPRGAVDDSTRRRQSFFERKEPQTLSGELWVDSESSVVVKASLRGKLRVPSGPNNPKDAVVDVSLDSLISEVGKEAHLPAPENFLPDADKPSGIAEVLERFGIRTKDAGVSGEPDDDST